MIINLPRHPNRALLMNRCIGRKGVTIGKLKSAEADAWLGCLKEVLGPPPYKQFDTLVHITIYVTGAGRRIDVPNWVGHLSWKVLVDCLTEPRGNKHYGLGILKDDSVRYVTGMSVKVDPDGEQSTLIVIEEVE